METTHVLVIDASPGDVATVEHLLHTAPGATSRYYVESTDDFIEAEKALVRNSHDVVLLDYNVPNSPLTGAEMLKRVNAGGCQTPVVLLSVLPDDVIEAQAEEAGAAGFLHKKLDMTERTLRHAIRYAVHQHKELTEVQVQLAKLVEEVARLNRKLLRR